MDERPMISRRPARFRILAVVHVVVGLLSLPLILGAFGLLPLALGVVLGATAAASLCVARGIGSRGE
jgi:hypothetical protein